MIELMARIARRVRHEQPDARLASPPLGLCRVQAHEGVVSIEWVEGNACDSIVISADEFEDNLLAGAIVILPQKAPPRMRAEGEPA